jgi:hypothetical protein
MLSQLHLAARILEVLSESNVYTQIAGLCSIFELYGVDFALHIMNIAAGKILSRKLLSSILITRAEVT